MARARNIKPGFFKNADLLELAPLTRLLFAGLWCIADREGRIEDRPRQIKLEVMPADECDVDVMLNDLHNSGFINRYEVDGEKFLRILKWKKHQNPHMKEVDSAIPEPKRASPEKPGTSPEKSGLAGTIPEQAEKTPEPTGLIPDSLNLIPSSLITAVADEKTEPEKDSDAEAIRRWLEQYTEGKFGAAGDPIVLKMLQLLGSRPVEDFQDFLIGMHKRKLKPDKSYGWFVPMAEDYFGGRNGRK